MRTLIYGMQSSGASLFTYFLCQKPNTIGVIDLFNKHIAPAFLDVKEIDIILKCVITTRYFFVKHAKNFRANKKILFIRNPYANYVSLKTKPWKNQGGSMENKFRILERVFQKRNKLFNLMVTYEDFINKNDVVMNLKNVGIDVNDSFYNFNRSVADIRRFNRAHTTKLKLIKYAKGMIRLGGIDRTLNSNKISKEDMEKVENLCPSVCNFYNAKINEG